MNATLRGFRWLGIGETQRARPRSATPFLGLTCGVLPLLLPSLTESLPAQAQFRTEVNPDGTVTITGGCTAGAVTIPDTIDGRKVTSIGSEAFRYCSSLIGAYFEGSPPRVDGSAFMGVPATFFYLPGTQGWETTFSDRPTAPWVRPNPTILDFGDRFGPSTNSFGFVVSWATNVPVVVEASADITNPTWTPVSTNTLTDGWVQFTDPEWKSQPARFYRVRGK